MTMKMDAFDDNAKSNFAKERIALPSPQIQPSKTKDSALHD